MCGLAGFTGHREAVPAKLRMLLMENESRGRHSTGIYGNNRLMRKALPATEFLEDTNFDHIASSKMVIAHTRLATAGEKTKANSHPFRFIINKKDGSSVTLIGSHNGFVVNQYEMTKLISGFKEEDVDSKGMYKAMATLIFNDDEKELKNIGIDNPWEIFQKFEGAMAIVFAIDDYLLMYRRESRPLFLGADKEGIYYSSIRSSLKKIGIRDEAIIELNPHILFAFKDGKLIFRKDIEKPRVNISEHKTSYTWDAGISDKLKEELTGKKPYISHSQAQIGYNRVGNASTKAIECLTREEMMTVFKQTRFGTHMLTPSFEDVRNIDNFNRFVKKSFEDPALNKPDKGKSIIVPPLVYTDKFWLSKTNYIVKFPLPFTISEIKENVHTESTSQVSVSFKGFNWRSGIVTAYSRNDIVMKTDVYVKKEREIVCSSTLCKSERTENLWLYKNKNGVDVFNDGDTAFMGINIMFGNIPGLVFRTNIRVLKGYNFKITLYLNHDIIDEFIKLIKHHRNLPGRTYLSENLHAAAISVFSDEIKGFAKISEDLSLDNAYYCYSEISKLKYGDDVSINQSASYINEKIKKKSQNTVAKDTLTDKDWVDMDLSDMVSTVFKKETDDLPFGDNGFEDIVDNKKYIINLINEINQDMKKLESLIEIK